MAMNAQLMIFSGRPDPEFPLADDLVEDIASRLSQVVGVTQADTPPEGGLGYRGFRVVNTESRAGLPEELEVFRGVVTEITAGDSRHWVDTAGVEGLLLAEARAAGLGELLDAVGLDEGLV